MATIKEVLIRRDGMTSTEAEELINEAKEQLSYYLESGQMIEAEDICSEYFGLEPDYIDELF